MVNRDFATDENKVGCPGSFERIEAYAKAFEENRPLLREPTQKEMNAIDHHVATVHLVKPHYHSFVTETKKLSE